jgi:hypothetical protein
MVVKIQLHRIILWPANNENTEAIVSVLTRLAGLPVIDKWSVSCASIAVVRSKTFGSWHCSRHVVSLGVSSLMHAPFID